jgi:branched-chain amino acid transport system ATP-binding protein
MLSADSVTKHFGGAWVLRNATLSVPEGGIVGLVGPNGSGKTTLLNCLSGFLRPDGGSVHFDGRRIDRLPDWKVSRLGVRRTFQAPAQPMKMTVLESMLCGAASPVGASPIRGLLQPRRRLEEERASVEKARELLAFLKLDGKQDHAAGRLSGGQQKLLSLGVALMTEPKVLLLDEPTAGVAPPLRRTLVERLQEINARGTTILVIEHDMHFIGSLCGLVHVLDKGEVIASCKPSQLKEDSRVVEAYLGSPRRPRLDATDKVGGAA